jgi:hypothetical protein
MTPAERKEAMPHGGQRRVAKRINRSETFINLVMNDGFVAKTPKGAKTLKRAQAAIAEVIGRPVEEVFDVEPAPAPTAAVA